MTIHIFAFFFIVYEIINTPLKLAYNYKNEFIWLKIFEHYIKNPILTLHALIHLMTSYYV